MPDLEPLNEVEDDGDHWVEPLDRAFCDVYQVHDEHVYTAINHNVYDCPGMVVSDLVELERLANEPPCEHGLSAHLCAGPGHYPDDRRDW